MLETFFRTPIGRFRLIGLLEGISYLVLLGISMPLKYFADWPVAVKYTGWAHGILFMIYAVLLLLVWIDRKWNVQKTTIAFLAALIPFGTFILDRQLKKEQADLSSV